VATAQRFSPWLADGLGPPSLDDGAAHLWVADLNVDDALRAELVAGLADDERRRAQRMRGGPAGSRFEVARGLLRRLLAAYTGAEARALRFAYGPRGKPALADPAGPRFSVSHYGGLALYAVRATGDVGVDVERRRRIGGIDAIAARALDGPRRAVLERLAGDERDEAFLRWWTRQEACVKVHGDALFASLRCIAAPVGGEAVGAASRTAGGRLAYADLDPGPQHVGAVAVEGTLPPLRAWRLDPGSVGGP